MTKAMKLMIGSASRGGMRSVVEAYDRDGFLAAENVRVIFAYREGHFAARQIVLIRALAAFVWCLLSRRVELVHCHASVWGSFWRKGVFASLARLFGIPVVLHLHGSEMKQFWAAQRPWAQRLVRRHLEKATRVVVLSESWKAFIGAVAPKASIAVVPNYVRVPPGREPDRRGEDTVLFLGLIGPRKGTFDLIRAFAAVRSRHPRARLVLGGNGQVAEATQLATDLCIQDSVVIAGWVDGDAKAELLRSAPIYVLPSHNEGLPVSVLEAMAAGAAVVTTRVGGLPELVTDGVHGTLVEPGDLDGLAEALNTLLGDRAMQNRMAAAGRQRIEENYSDRVVLPRLHRIYADVRR